MFSKLTVNNLTRFIAPSRYDHRDRHYRRKNSLLRESVDLREWDSPIESQRSLGSCSGNAMTNAYELTVKRIYPDRFTELSRLFVYYNSRVIDNTTGEDVGAYLRSTLAAVKHQGICTEKLWPYNVDLFNVQPPAECYQDAAQRTITNYQSLDTLDDVLDALNQNKPVIIGLTVYDSFNQVDRYDPVIKMPSRSELGQGGGHAMTAVGYDLNRRQILVKNSFGTDWGTMGYGWLPFDYVSTEGFENWIFDISTQPIL
jgi:C1A family cysteine protease